MYCIVTPTLYTVDITTGDWTVVSLPVGNNRWKELRRLVQKTIDLGTPRTKSQMALQILQSVKSKKNKKNRDGNRSKQSTEQGGSTLPSSSMHATKLVDTFLVGDKVAGGTTTITDGTKTIEERIGARAQERERNLEEAKEAQNNPREERVAVADALFTHASHVLRRSSQNSTTIASRFGTNTSNNNPTTTTCVLTFGDIVKTVLTNRSRKEISNLLVELVKVSPSNHKSCFIRWQDPRSGKNGVPISKDATVWINTADYKHVRAILNGEIDPLLTRPTAGKAGTASLSIPSQPHPNQNPSEAASPAAVAPRDLTPVAPPKSHAPVVTVSTKKALPPSSPHHMEHGETGRIESHLYKKRPAASSSQDDDSSGPTTKVTKSLKSLSAPSSRTKSMVQQSNSSAAVDSSSTKKRPAEDAASFEGRNNKKKTITCSTKYHSRPVGDDDFDFESSSSSSDDSSLANPQKQDHQQHPGVAVAAAAPMPQHHLHPQQQKRLRINPNLVLCDADYDGGTIIQPSLELPRGLRRLFLALNAGERI
jgi:hypothetical protein